MRSYLSFIIIISILVASCGQAGNKQEDKSDTTKYLSGKLVDNPVSANGIDTTKLNSLPVMTCTDTVYDFHTLQQGEVVEHDFTFTNTGKSPLIITDATASCGCTIPAYPRDPIAPGKNGIIKVKFNTAGKTGHQDKSVRLSNNTAAGVKMLYIKAEVNAPKNQ